MNVMRALTICQPYAHLICVTREKIVENRKWKPWEKLLGTRLYIHAGMSRDWLEPDYVEPANMFFGAIIGSALLWDYATKEDVCAGKFDKEFPKLKSRLHVHGPFCWILMDVKQYAQPVYMRGAQGIWNVPAEKQKDVLVQEQEAVAA